MKLIFLDMDGVINSLPNRHIMHEFKMNHSEKDYLNKFYGIDPDLAKLVKTIIDETNCKIVSSSTWRLFKDHPIVGEDWRKSFQDLLGYDSDDIFFGNTPSSSQNMNLNGIYRQRGLEIKSFLDDRKNLNIESYCIIDDEIIDIVSVFDSSVIVKTNYETGITIENVNRAIQILNNKHQEKSKEQ